MSILGIRYTGSRAKIMMVAIVLAVACAVYTYQQRYFLRFVPIPLSEAAMLNEGSWLFPAYERSKLNGVVDFAKFDLRTEAGLRKVLNAIQAMSPLKPANGISAYDYESFENWIKQIAYKPIFCTDGTLLFIAAAAQQGLMAREWHLLPPGWPPGQGHSVAEFYNPATKRWQTVDAQHAAIIRDKAGKILDMVSVLRSYKNKRPDDIHYDYGRYEKAMLGGARGATTAAYFFDADLLRTPVLQLRQPTWFATVAKRFGLSGHFVIGYPIMVDGWTHDYRVWLTKVTAAGLVVFGLVAIAAFMGGRGRKTAVKYPR